MTIYQIYANKTNIGDYLSALAIRKYITPQKNITHLLCDKPYISATQNILGHLSKDDVVIIGGGGLLMDYFIQLWRTLIDNYTGYKLFIWGIGECSNNNKGIDSRVGNQIIQEISQIATKIAVRDFALKQRFDDCGRNVEMVGCPSTFIASAWPKQKNKYLLHIVHPGLIRDTLPEWKSSCKALAEKLNLTYVESNHLLPKSLVKRYFYWNNTLSYYQNASIIVSSRLHGVILGSVRGIPVIPVSNDLKINSYWEGTLGGKSILNATDFNKLESLVITESYDNPEFIFRNAQNLIFSNKQYASEILKLIG